MWSRERSRRRRRKAIRTRKSRRKLTPTKNPTTRSNRTKRIANAARGQLRAAFYFCCFPCLVLGREITKPYSDQLTHIFHPSPFNGDHVSRSERLLWGN